MAVFVINTSGMPWSDDTYVARKLETVNQPWPQLPGDAFISNCLGFTANRLEFDREVIWKAIDVLVQLAANCRK